MDNFPRKVFLNEVPRLNTWPIQFRKSELERTTLHSISLLEITRVTKVKAISRHTKQDLAVSRWWKESFMLVEREENPVLINFNFPSSKNPGLRTLISQSGTSLCMLIEGEATVLARNMYFQYTDAETKMWL